SGAGIRQPAQAQADQQRDGCRQTNGRLAECERTDALTRNCTAATQFGSDARRDYGASLSDPNSGFTATHELARALGPDPPDAFEANDPPTSCSRDDNQSKETENADAPRNFEKIDQLKRQAIDPKGEEM